MTQAPALRMYRDLARWWPLLSPPSEYDEEAADLLGRLPRSAGSQPPTLLELGSGGGSLAAHLKHHYELTLTDRSPEMLAVSRMINPECEHLQGDMRSLRLHRRFDVVLVHDAIMYAVEPADVRATLSTASLHCLPGGLSLSCPTTSGKPSRPVPNAVATIQQTDEGSGTWSGGGTPTRRTTPISSSTPSSFGRAMVPWSWSTIVIRKGFSRGPTGWYGSRKPASSHAPTAIHQDARFSLVRHAL